MTDTGSIPAVRTGGFPAVRTGSIPAIRTGGFPAVNGQPRHAPRPARDIVPPEDEKSTSKKRPAASAVNDFSALRRRRKQREEILRLVLTGAAVFLLLFCLTGVTAYAAVSSALDVTGGSSPLPESYAIASLPLSAGPSEEDQKSDYGAVAFSEEDYEERLLVPDGFSVEEDPSAAPEPPPQDEDGRYILASSALPETYSVTVETEEGVFVYKTYTKTEEISYKTVYKDTRELAKGKEVVQSEGHNGTTSYTVKETYKDGVLQEKEIVEKKITREVQDRVILRGIGQAVTGSDGKSYAYTKQLSMKAYCYYKGEDGGSRSATGKTLRYGMIAVDPRVIPLGTRVYIDAPGTAFDGVFVAEDTGGAIKGNIIDIYMETRSKALSFGTQSVKVYILE